MIAHVTKGLSATTGEDFALSAVGAGSRAEGSVGEKSGAGFYKRVGKEIHTLDWKTGEYGPQVKPDDAGARAPHAAAARRAFAALRQLGGPQDGDFVREYLLRFSHYVLTTTPAIAYDIASVDHAIEWGYAWEAGPFKQMDAARRRLPARGIRRARARRAGAAARSAKDGSITSRRDGRYCR